LGTSRPGGATKEGYGGWPQDTATGLRAVQLKASRHTGFVSLGGIGT